MIATVINFIAQTLVILVIVDVFLGYFVSPYHPVRQFIDRIVEPMLMPIRKVVPPIQMIDLSPLILIVLIQIINRIILAFL